MFVFLPLINSLGKYSQRAIVPLFGDNLNRHLLESKYRKTLPSSFPFENLKRVLYTGHLSLIFLLLFFSPGREEEAKNLNPNFLSGKAGAYLNDSCNLVAQK